jgi:hypothetical protein
MCGGLYDVSFPSANGFDPSQLDTGVPSYPPPPFLDPTLNAGFVVAAEQVA